MSYDLELAFPVEPDPGSIRAAATEAGLRTEGSKVLSFFDSTNGLVFTADGPYAVQAVDLDEELLAVVPHSRWGMLISRPAAAGDEGIRRALIVATAIARANRGAVYDPQTETLVFPLRAVAKQSARESRVRLVSLTWLVAQNRALADIAKTWLGLVRRFFPEAVPSRYDTTEPMQHQLEPGGEDDFYAFWEAANREVIPWVLFKSAAPCFGGIVSLLGPSPTKHQPIAIQMDFDGGYLEANAASRRACTDLFRAVAEDLGCFYAAGHVERNWIVARRNLSTDSQTETLHILKKTEWLGLPPFPVWLSWYGGPYKERVRPSLERVSFEENPEGLLLRLGDMPQDVDQVSGRFPGLPADLRRQPQPPLRPGISTGATDFSLPAKTLLDLTGPLPTNRFNPAAST
jgi:hypothetical protein